MELPEPVAPSPPADRPTAEAPVSGDENVSPVAGDLEANRDLRPIGLEAALAHIVDDEGEAEEALEWASKRMLAGQTTEQIAGELREAGWPDEKADELAEFARRQTRAQRGVLTREDVAALEARKHRAAWRFSYFTAFPVWSSAYRLMMSFVHWRTISSIVRRQKFEPNRDRIEWLPGGSDGHPVQYEKEAPILPDPSQPPAAPGV